MTGVVKILERSHAGPSPVRPQSGLLSLPDKPE